MSKVLHTNMTSGRVNAGSNPTFTTASITPKKNRLYIIAVSSAIGSGGNINTPTASGNGITWTAIDTIKANGNNWQVTLFKGMSASPSAGAITISFGGQSQDQGGGWSVEEFENVTPDISKAVVQSITGKATGTNTGLTLNFASAFRSNRNAAYGYVASQGPGITPGSGYVSTAGGTYTASFFLAEFSGSQQSSASWSWSATGTEGPGIAIELSYFRGNSAQII